MAGRQVGSDAVEMPSRLKGSFRWMINRSFYCSDILQSLKLYREITFLHRKYICLLYCTAISEVNFILSALKHGVTLKKELIDRFEDLPIYKALKLKDMDTSDP